MYDGGPRRGVVLKNIDFLANYREYNVLPKGEIQVIYSNLLRVILFIYLVIEAVLPVLQQYGQGFFLVTRLTFFNCSIYDYYILCGLYYPQWTQ